MAHRGSAEPSQRQLRVGEEIRHALSEILARETFRDPDLQDVSVTVTEVRPAPDLRVATAYVIPLGGVDADRTVAALNRAAGFVRGRLGRMIHLKFLPTLHFEADRSFDAASRVDALLHDPRVARDLDADGGADPDPDAKPDASPDDGKEA
jgi:ribosome-binding factor A